MPISDLMSMSIKCWIFTASACTSSKQLKSQGLGIKQLHIVFTALIVSHVLYALPAWGGFLSYNFLDKIDYRYILRKDHKFGCTTEVLIRLRICCKMQIISSFRSDLVTASIHNYPTSKWLTLSSTALELASICLTAVINCTNNHSSIDVFLTTAIDMCCCVLHFVFHIFIRISYILFDLI